MKQHFQITAFLFFLLVNACLVKSQDTSVADKKVYYRLTIGAGIGSGYPLQQDDFGVGANFEFAVQKQKSVYGLGVRGL